MQNTFEEITTLKLLKFGKRNKRAELGGSQTSNNINLQETHAQTYHNKTENQRKKTNLESNERTMDTLLIGEQQLSDCRLLIRNHRVHISAQYIFKVLKENKCQAIILFQ